ncbi:MAG: hypothetical protein NWE98_01220 [Candidatus Bathyarchaeota archaeon]|nr:hypothetical protein [Candidatus Bathyarchaeota archaeon]
MTKPTNSPHVPNELVLFCPLCRFEMMWSKIYLRVAAWNHAGQVGQTDGALGKSTDELLHVTVYVCSGCGKLEFVGQEKTVQKIISEHRKGLR